MIFPQKKTFFIFSYKKRQKLAFLFYLRWRPTTLLLIIIYKNTYPKSIWELVSAIKNTLEIEINLYFAEKFGGILQLEVFCEDFYIASFLACHSRSEA
jgi:hypothetical protein